MKPKKTWKPIGDKNLPPPPLQLWQCAGVAETTRHPAGSSLKTLRFAAFWFQLNNVVLYSEYCWYSILHCLQISMWVRYHVEQPAVGHWIPDLQAIFDNVWNRESNTRRYHPLSLSPFQNLWWQSSFVRLTMISPALQLQLGLKLVYLIMLTACHWRFCRQSSPFQAGATCLYVIVCI